MADPVLHIKDAYYFEVPKVLYPSTYKSVRDFPEVWVTLDPDFQQWEFERLYDGLAQKGVGLPPKDSTKGDWQAWVHSDHANASKPFDEFLEFKYTKHATAFNAWQAEKVADAKKSEDKDAVASAKSLQFDDYVARVVVGEPAYIPFSSRRADDLWNKTTWRVIKSSAGDVQAYVSAQEQSAAGIVPWDSQKIRGYNTQLSGKIVIPQPFGGKLRNLYQPDSGFCVSKFMIIELVVAIILCVVFSWLGGRTKPGGAPRGKLWNLLEMFVVYIRDHIAEPAIGHHEARAFVPLLCTLFFFVLGCNLFGMLPWLGAPTGSFGVTFGIACVTFGTVIVCGMLKFGLVGFFLNQVPHMDLPIYMAVLLKPMIFAIEMLGLCIKHLVLSVRLLANMVAGHLVLLGVMGLAFGAHAAMQFSAPDVPGWQWPVTATIAVVGSTLFSLLELLVAFLQAYIFTFLSALFIGAAIHHH